MGCKCEYLEKMGRCAVPSLDDLTLHKGDAVDRIWVKQCKLEGKLLDDWQTIAIAYCDVLKNSANINQPEAWCRLRVRALGLQQNGQQ